MTLADLFNLEAEIDFKGVKYKLRQPTQIEQAKFQRWLETRAREAIERSVDLPEERQRQLHTDLTAEIAAGAYEWNGEIAARAVRTPLGLAKLLSLTMEDQGITLEIAADMVATKLQEIAAILTSKATEDPKALAAILRTLGLPSDYLSSNSSTRRSTKRSRKSRR